RAQAIEHCGPRAWRQVQRAGLLLCGAKNGIGHVRRELWLI
ncbi:hypothetical protein PSYAE_10499, partial [Pseudomonas amygdali pv. aesculi str. 0893_23]